MFYITHIPPQRKKQNKLEKELYQFLSRFNTQLVHFGDEQDLFAQINRKAAQLQEWKHRRCKKIICSTTTTRQGHKMVSIGEIHFYMNKVSKIYKPEKQNFPFDNSTKTVQL